jgi:hypothetical protein
MSEKRTQIMQKKTINYFRAHMEAERRFVGGCNFETIAHGGGTQMYWTFGLNNSGP